jgi:hypothetical protein
MSDAKIWAETLVIVTVVTVVAAITWSVTRRRETFSDKGAAQTGLDYELFFTIVNAYKTTLDRPPSEAEIQMQKARLANDPAFDIAKLEMTLRQSGEYRRLVTLQQNAVHAELEGTMTDRQVLQKVVEMYKEVAGNDPDDATTAFLLERYRKSRLDDVYLSALIENITMAPSESRGRYVGPDGPGEPKAVDTSEAVDAGSGSDLKALIALYEKLGIDTAALKAGKMNPAHQVKALALQAVKDKALGAEGTWKAMGSKCPVDPQLVDMTPDALSKLVSSRNRETLKSAACANAWLKNMDELKAAGYGPGKKIGSWTLPEKLRAPVCVGGRDGAYGPINSQTSLIGTLLTDNVTKDGDMNLL